MQAMIGIGLTDGINAYEEINKKVLARETRKEQVRTMKNNR